VPSIFRMALAAGLEEALDDVAEGLGVGGPEALGHRGVQGVRRRRLVEHPVLRPHEGEEASMQRRGENEEVRGNKQL